MSSTSGEPSIRSVIFSVPTHVTPQPEFHKHHFPVATLFIGPTNPKGQHPEISKAAMCRIFVFKKNFAELTKTVSRFMGRDLRLVVVGSTTVVKSNDEYIPLFNNCRFIHREAGGYHVLCHILPTDISGKEAQIRLGKFVDDLETSESLKPATSPPGRKNSRSKKGGKRIGGKRRFTVDSNNEDDENSSRNLEKVLRFD